MEQAVVPSAPAAGPGAARVHVDWRAIGREFHANRTPRLVRQAAEAAGLDADAVSALRDRLGAEGDPPAADEAHLERLWTAAAARPGATFLLAFLFYAECQWVWERVDDGAAVGRLARRVAASWRPRGAPAAEDALTGLLMEHLEDLLDCVGIENGINCSCPVRAGELAERVRAGVTGRLGRLGRLGAPADSPEAALLSGVLRAHLAYADGVCWASDALGEAIDGTEGSVDGLRTTGARLRTLRFELEAALDGDVFGTELGAHARSLDALADRLHAGLGGLLLPQVTATYLFPFTLALEGSTDGSDGGSADGSVDVDAAVVARLLTLPVGRPGPLPRPVDVSRPDRSDMWAPDTWSAAGRAAADGPDAVALQLPDVTIVDTAGYTHAPFTVEVRLHASGNHYVRIAGSYPGPDDANPDDTAPGAPLAFHDLNQLLRRGTDFMGWERITPAGDPADYGTLAHLATELVRHLSGWAAEAGLRGVEARINPAVDGHVLATIKRAVVADGDGQREATGQDLLDRLGPLLLVPAERTATSFEDWVHLGTPEDAATARLLGDLAPRGSLAVQNPRATTLYLPGEPDWRMLEFTEMVEFAVSQPVLTRSWIAEVQDQIDRALPAEGGVRRSADEIEELRARMAAEAARLGRLRARVRSADLTRSTTHRRLLDRMLERTGVARLDEDLVERIAQLDVLYDRLGGEQRSKEEARKAGYERVVQRILFVVALFSFADVLGVVNTLFFAGGVTPPARVVEAIAYAAVLVGLTLRLLVLERRRQGTEDR